jgi:hypothetical protein
LGFDLVGRPALDCYVFGVTRTWDGGRWPESVVRMQLDPDRLQTNHNLRENALSDVYCKAIDEPRTRLRDQASWWDLGVLLLLAFDPDFDGTSVGLAEPLLWTNSIFGYAPPVKASCRRALHLERAAPCEGVVAGPRARSSAGPTDTPNSGAG